MRDLLDQLPEVINKVFGILVLFVDRLTILGLAVMGAYALLRHHAAGRGSSATSRLRPCVSVKGKADRGAKAALRPVSRLGVRAGVPRARRGNKGSTRSS